LFKGTLPKLKKKEEEEEKQGTTGLLGIPKTLIKHIFTDLAHIHTRTHAHTHTHTHTHTYMYQRKMNHTSKK
jgi:hypothetical protein